jgi:hypothetical protein
MKINDSILANAPVLDCLRLPLYKDMFRVLDLSYKAGLYNVSFAIEGSAPDPVTE